MKKRMDQVQVGDRVSFQGLFGDYEFSVYDIDHQGDLVVLFSSPNVGMDVAYPAGYLVEVV